MLFRFLTLFVLARLASSLLFDPETTEVEINGNPHTVQKQPEEGASICNQPVCQVQNLLSPHRIVPTQMANLQQDTLIQVTTAKVMGVPVPIYHFHQPARLSKAELPYQMVLVTDIDHKEGLVTVTVDPMRSLDSWFPGYRWSPLVCQQCGPNHVHVGWKFENEDHESFYALLVQVKPHETVAEGVTASVQAMYEMVVVSQRAPGWMVSGLPKLM